MLGPSTVAMSGQWRGPSYSFGWSRCGPGRGHDTPSDHHRESGVWPARVVGLDAIPRLSLRLSPAARHAAVVHPGVLSPPQSLCPLGRAGVGLAVGEWVVPA